MPTLLKAPTTKDPLAQGTLNLGSMGVRATSPTQNVSTPATSLPKSQTAPTSQQPTFSLGSGTPKPAIQTGTVTSTPQVPASGAAQNPIAALGIGSTNGVPNTLGSGPTFQPLNLSGNLSGPGNNIQQSAAPQSGGLPTAAPQNNAAYTNPNQNYLTPTGPAGTPLPQQGQAQPQAPQPQGSQSPTSLPGLLQSIQGFSNQSAQSGQQAQQIAQDYGKQIADVGNQAALGQEALYSGGGPSSILQGNALAQAQLGAARQQALGTGEQAALQGVGYQQSGLQNATTGLQNVANLAPSALTYGAFDGGGSFNPQSVASQLAQLVNSGQMTNDQATSQMNSLYGGSGATFLQQALTGTPGSASSGGVNSGFNYVQANQNSQIQGQLAPQVQLAQNELSNLQQTLAQAPALQQTSIPLVNSFGSWLNNLTGNPSSTALTDARTAATSAVGTAIAAAYGGTPSQYDSLINQWFPQNASPQQIAAGIQQFNNMVQFRAQSFSSPGTVPQVGSSGSSGGSIWSF